MLYRYTFGKPVTGKLTVNMTVNGVGYYRHEMGHPVIKNMEVSLFIPWSTRILMLLFMNLSEMSKLVLKQDLLTIMITTNGISPPLSLDKRLCELQPVRQGHDALGCSRPLQGHGEHLGVGNQHRWEQANHI